MAFLSYTARLDKHPDKHEQNQNKANAARASKGPSTKAAGYIQAVRTGAPQKEKGGKRASTINAPPPKKRRCRLEAPESLNFSDGFTSLLSRKKTA